MEGYASSMRNDFNNMRNFRGELWYAFGKKTFMTYVASLVLLRHSEAACMPIHNYSIQSPISHIFKQMKYILGRNAWNADKHC